jgi:hypothetical protein
MRYAPRMEHVCIHRMQLLPGIEVLRASEWPNPEQVIKEAKEDDPPNRLRPRLCWSRILVPDGLTDDRRLTAIFRGDSHSCTGLVSPHFAFEFVAESRNLGSARYCQLNLADTIPRHRGSAWCPLILCCNGGPRDLPPDLKSLGHLSAVVADQKAVPLRTEVGSDRAVCG